LKADGSAASGAFVILTDTDGKARLIKADSEGNFKISTLPGTYNVEVSDQLSRPTSIKGARLHEGLQVLQPIQIPQPTFETVTMGDIVGIRQSGFMFAIRHPWSFLRYVGHRVFSRSSRDGW